MAGMGGELHRSFVQFVEMCKLFVLSALLIAFVYSAVPGFPTEQEARSEMLAAGLSSQAVDGILSVATSFASSHPTPSGTPDREDARNAFNEFVSQVDAYIKTQSPEDQTAYANFIAKKKADFEARVAARQA